jgi:hypothetical protein
MALSAALQRVARSPLTSPASCLYTLISLGYDLLTKLANLNSLRLPNRAKTVVPLRRSPALLKSSPRSPESPLIFRFCLYFALGSKLLFRARGFSLSPTLST